MERWRRWLNQTEIPASVRAVLYTIVYAGGIVFGYHSEHSLVATVLVGVTTMFLVFYTLYRLVDDPGEEEKRSE